jgi:hypothetical protein
LDDEVEVDIQQPPKADNDGTTQDPKILWKISILTCRILDTTWWCMLKKAVGLEPFNGLRLLSVIFVASLLHVAYNLHFSHLRLFFVK